MPQARRSNHPKSQQQKTGFPRELLKNPQTALKNSQQNHLSSFGFCYCRLSFAVFSKWDGSGCVVPGEVLVDADLSTKNPSATHLPSPLKSGAIGSPRYWLPKKVHHGSTTTTKWTRQTSSWMIFHKASMFHNWTPPTPVCVGFKLTTQHIHLGIPNHDPILLCSSLREKIHSWPCKEVPIHGKIHGESFQNKQPILHVSCVCPNSHVWGGRVGG